ncbi:UNVERIFIED_CONTAM: Tryptophan aminotransferase-related protein 4 [Sesamum calycinum]|uniref:Tryptophan aminotransferase-related protein 4 n=1 Tax=Sesamum calycinum TaxID=2727403 RepID=A0AAW2P7Y5_9LAMI
MAESDQNRFRFVKALSWSARAAAEVEAVASISCSGHGRAFLDGLIENGKPVCECNACYGGPDCSQLLPNCVADADRILQAKQFEFHGDASSLRNGTSNTIENVIEFVASPNNPDGNLKKAVLEGPSVKTIHDYAYYWPHYTAIPAPADEDLMIFTMSKLTGHAGSRFGTQLRALKLIKVVLENGGRGIYNFAYKTMRGRWTKLNHVLSLSKRFKLQEIPPSFCNYSRTVRGASPAFAWLKCTKEEDSNCYKVLHQEANILGREGSSFDAENHYVRLSLVKRADEFNLLLDRLEELVSKEDQNQTTRSS